MLSEGNTTENLKNMSGFTEAFIQGSDNLKTSALPHHDKSKLQVQAINKGKYIESTRCGEHYHLTLF